MFLEEKRQGETKADPFSLASLIAWLEKQQARNTYNYNCTGHCLLAQYFLSAGFTRVSIGSYTMAWGQWLEDVRNIPPHFNDIAQTRPLTFGAALERARKLAAEQQ